MNNVRVKITADGRILARRTDGQPMTPTDRDEARMLAEREKLQPDDDPILAPDQWYPYFKEFFQRVIGETKDFDYLWVKENRPDLYSAIKSKERELDALGQAKLSTVIGIMTEWRRLMLAAEMDRKKAIAPERSAATGN